MFTATILVWPIVEALFMFLLIGMTSQLGLDAGGAGVSNTDAAGVYLVYTIMNLVMVATIIAAPFVTLALINNSGSITGLVTPFVGGALAATGAVTKAMLDKPMRVTANATGSALGHGGAAGGGAAWNAASNLRGPSGPSPVVSPSSPRSSRSPTGSTPAASGSARPNVVTTASVLDAAQGGTSSLSSGADAGGVNTDAEPKPKRTTAQKARRGAIIHQQHKART